MGEGNTDPPRDYADLSDRDAAACSGPGQHIGITRTSS
jgi:hypothetical protein